MGGAAFGQHRGSGAQRAGQHDQTAGEVGRGLDMVIVPGELRRRGSDVLSAEGTN